MIGYWFRKLADALETKAKTYRAGHARRWALEDIAEVLREVADS